MKQLHSAFRLLVLPLCLLAGSCTSEPELDFGPVIGTKKAHGSFQVTLKSPTSITQGYTAVLGKLYDGPTPSALAWKEASESGGCKLLKPDAPFCETPCGSGALCVENGKCQDFPKSVTAGRVEVKGIKTKAGAAAFAMDPLLNSYQPAAGTVLEFPPFAEGEAVTFSAAGDSAVDAFTLTAAGISPLAILNDTIVLEDGKPIALRWTAPANPAGSSVSVLVDISHHGGTKGKIECDVPDNGSLDIPAAMVDELKALGVAGFPKLEASRKAAAIQAGGNVKLVLESMVVMDLSIPGLISCSGNEDCPSGQTCQDDLQCK
jgi:hypothetical protein